MSSNHEQSDELTWIEKSILTLIREEAKRDSHENAGFWQRFVDGIIDDADARAAPSSTADEGRCAYPGCGHPRGSIYHAERFTGRHEFQPQREPIEEQEAPAEGRILSPESLRLIGEYAGRVRDGAQPEVREQAEAVLTNPFRPPSHEAGFIWRWPRDGNRWVREQALAPRCEARFNGGRCGALIGDGWHTCGHELLHAPNAECHPYQSEPVNEAVPDEAVEKPALRRLMQTPSILDAPVPEPVEGWVRTGEVDTGWMFFKRAATWERVDGSALYRVPPEVERAIRAPLEAEIARLREALRQIQGWAGETGYETHQRRLTRIRDIATRTLRAPDEGSLKGADRG